MASIKNILFLFAILVSSTVTLAQGPSNDSTPEEPSSSIPPPDGSSEEPPPPLPSSAPGRFDHFAFKAPKFDFEWPQLPEAGFFIGSSRQKRAVNRRVINCNFANDGLFTCTGCHTVRRCYPFNKGTESTCTGFFQYCNNGQCSRNKGPLCDDTTSTSSSSSSTSTTASTSTTGSSSSTDSSSSSSTTESSSSTGSSSSSSSSSSTSSSTAASSSTTESSTSGSSTT